MKLFLVSSLAFLVICGQGYSQVNFTNEKSGKNNATDELNLFQFQNVRDFALNASGTELYFSVQSTQSEISGIVFSKKINGKWSKSELVNFSGRYQDLEPFLSADGLKLYFASNRPLTKTDTLVKDFDIWYVERKNVNDKWNNPKNCGKPINSEENEFYPSLTKTNNLYFTNDGKRSKGKDDIFVCYYLNGKYSPPISVSDSINTDGYEFNAFVSPNEDYLIFTGYNKPDGLGSGDLYISYKRKDGIWTKAKNMGEKINSKQMDYCPFVDEKTKTLYFTSKRNNIKNEFQKNLNINELLDAINTYENGQSRLYKVNADNWLEK